MHIQHGTSVPKLLFDSMRRKCVMQNYDKVVVYPSLFSFDNAVALSDDCGGQFDKCD